MTRYGPFVRRRVRAPWSPISPLRAVDQKDGGLRLSVSARRTQLGDVPPDVPYLYKLHGGGCVASICATPKAVMVTSRLSAKASAMMEAAEKYKRLLFFPDYQSLSPVAAGSFLDVLKASTARPRY